MSIRTNEIVVDFTCKFGDNFFTVLSFEIYESLTSSSVVSVNACCINLTLDLSELLMTAATIKLSYGENIQNFTGLLFTSIKYNDVKLDRDGQIVTYCEFILENEVGLLKNSENYRLFSNKNVFSIIDIVLSAHQINYKNLARGVQYKSIALCIQYGESDYVFLQRLCSEYGLYFYYDNSANSIVFSANSLDANSLNKSFDMMQTISGQDIFLDYILSLNRQIVLQPEKCKVVGHHAHKPSVSFHTALQGSGKSGVLQRHCDYFTALDDVESLLNQLVDMKDCQTYTVDGSSSILILSPGYVMDVKNHLQMDMNQPYFIKSVRHKYAKYQDNNFSLDITPQPLYENFFTAIPATTKYVETKGGPCPSIPNVMRAIVVSADHSATYKGVYANEYGQVYIRFFWQKDNEPGCWVKVMHNWAGAGFGTFALPRVGMEVLVSFVQGFSSQPVVIGALYNTDNTSKPLLDGQPWLFSIATESLANNGKYNELIFNDAANSESISLRAAKDFDVHVANVQRNAIVGGRETVIVKGNDALVLNQGNSVVGITNGDYAIRIESGQYELTLSHGGIKIKSGDAVTIESETDIHFEAKGNISVKSNSFDILSHNISIEAVTMNVNTTTLNLNASQVMSITAGVTISMDFPGKTQMFPMTS